jgi:hypothetical protein
MDILTPAERSVDRGKNHPDTEEEGLDDTSNK